MFRLNRKPNEVRFEVADPGVSVLTAGLTKQAMQTGSGDLWSEMWDQSGDQDDSRWDDFMAGDTAEKREVAWLLEK